MKEILSAPRQTPKRCSESGFTLIEILLVLGMFAVLASLVSINLIKPQASAYTDSEVSKLYSSIRSQQSKAFSGHIGFNKCGIRFFSDRYVLFCGDQYVDGDVNNVDNFLDSSVTFSTINLTNAEILFNGITGEVDNYSPSSNSLTLEHSSGEINSLSINRYGAIDIQ